MKTRVVLTISIFIFLFCTMPRLLRAQSGPAATYSFYAYNESYSYLSGGTSISGLANQDDAYATSIPIGFSFLFAGNYYTQLSINTNGWLSLNNYACTYCNENYLPTATTNLNSFGPCLLPLWEDISSLYGGTVTYATTGSAPNRVFTVEFKNSVWDYTASTPGISFQVRLYEGGVIKYHYKQESGSLSPGPYFGATIGIATSSTDYLVLNSSATSPTTTSSGYSSTQYSIGTKPADGQVYQFGDFPCNAAPTPVLNNVTSTTATINWNAMIPSTGYEYAFTTSNTPPSSGNTTSGLIYYTSGLTPNTQYYFHLRNLCTATQKTAWITIPVKTYPPCSVPSGFSVTDLTVESAVIHWNKLGHATGYEYTVNQESVDPTSTTPVTSTTDTFAKLKQLTEATKYYVHIRILCPGGEVSDWLLDSFTTLTVCRPPHLNVDYVDADRAVVYWNPMPTAIAYEYEVSQSATPLGNGTTIKQTDFFAFPLKDDVTYYFHVRSKCMDQGVSTLSDWATTSFTTFPTSVKENGELNHSISVFPNPVNDVLTIKLNDLNENAWISITDLAGRIVMNAKATRLIMDINMKPLNAGVYIVKYSNNDYSKSFRINKL